MRIFQSAPVIVGSEAHKLPAADRPFPELTHRWSCYVKVQPQMVKSVQFRLHESFVNSVLTVDKPPFQITEYGWGEFNIQIKIVLFNDEKIQTGHHLVLHGDSQPVISERFDSIVYRGEPIPIESEYNFKPEGEEEEYKRISEAIDYLIEQYDHLRSSTY